MKKIYFLVKVFTLFTSLLLTISCTKHEKATLPVLSTTTVNEIDVTTSTSGGNITSDGDASITARGVCWNTAPTPTTADNKTDDSRGTGIFSSHITNLNSGTKYYVRAYAINSAGTEYGNELSFTTTVPVDADGNVYHAVTIANQVWMVENLKTTKYNNGIDIPLATGNTEWINLTTPGYCWYNNDAATYKNIYGVLYNWYTVNTGILCPVGWHVPTDAEWTTLTTYLGGESVAGGKLKEAGTIHWNSPNTAATNETGFTALPGGRRSSTGSFSTVGNYGYWWSSTEYSSTDIWFQTMFSFNSATNISHYTTKILGFSVRCIKN